MDLLSERFQAIADYVGQHGYRVLAQAGQSDGADWEVRFTLAVEHPQYRPPIHTVAAPTEGDLCTFLRRWLPAQAATEWRAYALALEARR